MFAESPHKKLRGLIIYCAPPAAAGKSLVGALASRIIDRVAARQPECPTPAGKMTAARLTGLVNDNILTSYLIAQFDNLILSIRSTMAKSSLHLALIA